MTDQSIPPDDELLDAWYQALRGKSTAGQARPVVDRARKLREKILGEHAQREEAISDEELTRGREALLFRLSREGLLKNPKMVGVVRNPSWQLPLAIAASIGALGIAVMLVLQNTGPVSPYGEGQILAAYGEIETVRGDIPERPVQLAAPEAAARSLAGQLSRLGVPFVLQRGTAPGTLSMTIQLEGVAARQQARAELANLGVDAGTDEIVTVVFQREP